MRRKKIECEDAPEATIELVESDPHDPKRLWFGGKDHWPLASIRGGVDKMTVQRKGNTTIIKIVSPEGGSYLDPDGWERPKRQWRTRRVSPSAAEPKS